MPSDRRVSYPEEMRREYQNFAVYWRTLPTQDLEREIVSMIELLQPRLQFFKEFILREENLLRMSAYISIKVEPNGVHGLGATTQIQDRDIWFDFWYDEVAKASGLHIREGEGALVGYVDFRFQRVIL